MVRAGARIIVRIKHLKGVDYLGRPRQQMFEYARWHLENYIGWGEFKLKAFQRMPKETPHEDH